MELRILENSGLEPLRQKTKDLQALLKGNVKAHVVALHEEHLYLQEVIDRLYHQKFEVATLMKVNASQWDLEEFLESNVGVYFLEEERIETAQQALERLKGEKL